ncbi:hypothetical protein J7K50_08425 [bacterium]|nr:hypothetical protein [bacterium]
MTNLILIILLALVKAVGGGGIAEKEVSIAVQEALGEKVAAVHVNIDANPATFVAKGKISKLEFTLERFNVKPIVIEETLIVINGLKMNASDVLLGRKAVIKYVGPTEWKLTIGVEQLTAAVLDSAPAIENPYFRTVGKSIEFTGNYRLNKYMAVPFRAKGRLKIQNGTRVVLRLTDFNVIGIGAPARLIYMIEDAVNPLLDVDKLMEGKKEDIALYELTLNRELDPRIDSIKVLKGKIIGTGTI